MLELDQTVPDALILPERVEDLKAHLQSQKAHWFAAQPDYVAQTKTGAVQSMDSVTSPLRALPTQANKNNNLLSENGVQFREATQCGFEIDALQVDPTEWSCAVRFCAPGGSARTLFTLNPQGTDNYVFLQQVMRQMIFKDQQATFELTTESGPIAEVEMVLAGMSEGRLWLRAGSSEIIQSQPAALALDGTLSFFIGCRNNKGRLQKTLGEFHLLDLVVWPNLNILEPDQTITRDALDDALLWKALP